MMFWYNRLKGFISEIFIDKIPICPSVNIHRGNLIFINEILRENEHSQREDPKVV